MTKETTNSIADLCGEAQLLAASNLKAIVEACAEEAFGAKKSVAHAKFVLEIAQLAPLAAAEKKSKASQEKAETEPAENADGQPQRKSFSEIMVNMLDGTVPIP